jgi:hypothetical protein
LNEAIELINAGEPGKALSGPQGTLFASRLVSQSKSMDIETPLRDEQRHRGPHRLHLRLHPSGSLQRDNQ